MEDFNRVTRLELRIAKLEEQEYRASKPTIKRCLLGKNTNKWYYEQCVLKAGHAIPCVVVRDLGPGVIPSYTIG